MVGTTKNEIYHLVDKYGFPLAFAIIALLLFMGLLPSPITDIAKIIPSIDKKVDTVLQQHDGSQKVLRAICLNGSKTDEARSRCLE